MALAFGAEAAAAAAAEEQAPAQAAAPAPPAPAPSPAPAPAAAAKTGDEEQQEEQPAAAVQPVPASVLADPASAQTGDTCLVSDALALAAKAQETGFAAANARCKLVFDSAEGTANPAMASFLLFNSDANAATVIAQLKAAPGAAAPAKPARAAVTPRVDLTGGNGASTAAGTDADGAAAEFDPWAARQPTSANGASTIVAGGQQFAIVPVQPAAQR